MTTGHRPTIANLTKLAEEVRGGDKKLITRNGQREHIHLVLLDEASRGLDDVEAGCVMSVGQLERRLGRR